MKSGIPFWFDGVDAPAHPPLTEDMEADVAIIGGGIVGLTCAHRLQNSGLKAVVLEARGIGRQATGRSTAKVTAQHGRKYAMLRSKFGDEGARLYAEVNQRAVDEIAALASTMDGQAGLEPRSAYIYATDEKQAEQLEDEDEAARALGLPSRIVQNAGLPFPAVSLLEFTGQYQFDPYRYLLGLAEAVRAAVPIYEESRVMEIDDGDPCRLSVNGRTVTARHVVIATQMPVVNEGMFFAKAFPFAHPVAAALLPEGKPLDGMFISAGSPSHSLRTAEKAGRTYLIAAGGEYKNGEPDEERQMVDDLTAFLDSAFGIKQLSHFWTNEDFRPMDSAAFVGPASSGSDRLLVATGFEAWGISQGTVAADILAERILGREHRAATLFDATRIKPIAGGAEFTKENLKAAGHLVGDRVFKRASVPYESIAPGGGGVISHGGEQLAVHKRTDGTATALSAVCTHMGCIVGWNEVDRTWDCSCHGSRFDEWGEVIAGPAVTPLKAHDTAELDDETE
ncbi:FAD-dependent oxidoreductase [Nitratireductor sp. GCM10026969]|uniref:FAD-dependent oxidoreductase n=1 Tax=Nitratireductor sp. GCM10026969 TaxID=3252645 RepID=UPI003621BA05